MKITTLATLLALSLPATAVAQNASPIHNGYPRDLMLHNVGSDGFLKAADTIKNHNAGTWNPSGWEFSQFVAIKAPASFVDRLKQQSVILPNVRTTVTGTWKLVDSPDNQSTSTTDRTVTYEKSETYSKEFSAEVNSSIEVATVGGVKPFGVGVEVTVTGTLGFAFQHTSGVATTTTYSSAFQLPPGRKGQVWQGFISMRSEFKPETMFEMPPGAANWQYREPQLTYLQYSPRDAFHVAMFYSYGSVLWPNEFERLQKGIQTTKSQFRRYTDYDAAIIYLQGSDEPGYGSKMNKLRRFFSYEGFKTLDAQDQTLALPSPTFHMTTSPASTR